MNTIFSLRLDMQSRQKLQQLAEASFRSRGGVIRWLIHYASFHQGLLDPKEEITTEIFNHNETEDSVQGGLNGGLS